jgi:hypothetical protein
MAARDMAMKAAGVYVTKTESTNRTFTLSANIAADVTPAALLAAFKRVSGPT